MSTQSQHHPKPPMACEAVRNAAAIVSLVAVLSASFVPSWGLRLVGAAICTYGLAVSCDWRLGRRRAAASGMAVLLFSVVCLALMAGYLA
jgi:hypothetical protein